MPAVDPVVRIVALPNLERCPCQKGGERVVGSDIDPQGAAGKSGAVIASSILAAVVTVTILPPHPIVQPPIVGGMPHKEAGHTTEVDGESLQHERLAPPCVGQPRGVEGQAEQVKEGIAERSPGAGHAGG